MKCKDCKKYIKTGEGKGHCRLLDMNSDDERECFFFFDPTQRCGNCAWFEYDYDCHGIPKDRLACSSFMDDTEYDIVRNFKLLLRKGLYSREKIMELCDKFESYDEYEFFRSMKKESNSGEE